jgi:hypothetical protein
MKKQLLAIMLLAATISLKAQNPYPIIPIDSVQFVNQSKLTATPIVDLPDYISPSFVNPTYRDTVRFDGIVVTNPKTYGLSTSRKAAYIQKEGGGPWSGVLVMCDHRPNSTPLPTSPTLAQLLTETKFYENMVPGYKVRVTGKFAAFQGETQMNLMRDNANWSNAVEQVDLNTYQPVYTVISADSLMTGNPTAGTWLQKKATGEKWEGVLVEIRDVRVVGVSPFGTRWNWAIQDNAGNQLDIRDVSAYLRNDDNEDTVPKIPNNFLPPAIGTGLTYIRGIITEYQIGGVSRYGIAPMSPSDIGPCNVCPPSIGLRSRMPIIVTPTDSVTISTRILSDTALTLTKLFYAHKDSSVFSNVDMVKDATSDNWSGKIPPFSGNTIVKFYIRATDGRNLSTVVPDTFANGSFYYVTADGVKNIRDLQFAPNPANGASIWNGDSLSGISVNGVVTATRIFTAASNPRHLIIQDGQGPNSAIFIDENSTTNNWKIGDSVNITSARVSEFNVTTLSNITASVLKSGATLPSFETGLSLDSFRLNNIRFARPWEGVLMKWDSVYVINLNPDSNAAGDNFGEFTFNNDTSKIVGLRVDDASSSLFGINKALVKGQFLTYAQGPMTFRNSNFKLIPRNLNDLGLCNMDTLKPSIIVPATDTVFVGSGAYTHPNLTASDNKDGNLTSYIITAGTVNTAALGSYTVNYSVSDFCGNMATATRTVIVKDTPNTGIDRNDVVAANISIYPNPAKDVITISATDVKTLPLNIAVYDMIGREMLTRTFNDKNVNESINISNFNNGVYFLVMKNAQGTHSVKFVVTGK